MSENVFGIVLFLLVVYVFFTLYSTLSGFETKKQSKRTLVGFAVVVLLTVGIFCEVEQSAFKAVLYLLPLYFLYNFMQTLGNSLHKRLPLHLLNGGVAAAILFLLIN